MAPPPPPAELVDDVAGEIFLRLPPDEPEHLFRASLVCKPWFRLLTDPDFLGRYRAVHGTPPLLGYLKRFGFLCGRDHDPGLFTTTSVSLAPHPDYREALDCHHGRVLLRAADDDDWSLLVWDPVTGERKRLPDLGGVLRRETPHEGFSAFWDPDTEVWKRRPDNSCVRRCEEGNYAAAVCCAVSGCDHLDCRGGPFRVVFVAGGRLTQVKACVYSSETGAWSTLVTFGPEIYLWEGYASFQPRRSAIIGDEICFTILEDDAIVTYDMRNNRLSMINSPPVQQEYNFSFSVMEMDDGSLGFAYIRRSSLCLYVWSRKLNTSDGGGAAAEWVLSKVVELGERIPSASSSDHDRAYVAGAAEGMGAIFACTRAGLFTVKINSGQVKKIGELGVYGNIIPFMSFYTPDFVDEDVSRWRAIERIQKAERQREMIAKRNQMVMSIMMSLDASNSSFGTPLPQLDQAPQPNQTLPAPQTSASAQNMVPSKDFMDGLLNTSGQGSIDQQHHTPLEE